MTKNCFSSLKSQLLWRDFQRFWLKHSRHSWKLYFWGSTPSPCLAVLYWSLVNAWRDAVLTQSCLIWRLILRWIKRDSHPSGVMSVAAPFYNLWSDWHGHFPPGCEGRIVPWKWIRAEMKDVRGIFEYIKYDTRCGMVKRFITHIKRTWWFLMENMLITLLVKGWRCTQVMDVETNPLWQESGSWNGLWNWNDVGGTIWKRICGFLCAYGHSKRLQGCKTESVSYVSCKYWLHLFGSMISLWIGV